MRRSLNLERIMFMAHLPAWLLVVHFGVGAAAPVLALCFPCPVLIIADKRRQWAVQKAVQFRGDDGRWTDEAVPTNPCHPERREGSLGGQKSLPLASPFPTILLEPRLF